MCHGTSETVNLFRSQPFCARISAFIHPMSQDKKPRSEKKQKKTKHKNNGQAHFRVRTGQGECRHRLGETKNRSPCCDPKFVAPVVKHGQKQHRTFNSPPCTSYANCSPPGWQCNVRSTPGRRDPQRPQQVDDEENNSEASIMYTLDE